MDQTLIAEIQAICALPDALLMLIEAAMKAGVRIIIDGTHDYPTGKSRLCALLRKRGVHAVEAWELHERPRGRLSNPGANAATNTASVILLLNAPLL